MAVRTAAARTPTTACLPGRCDAFDREDRDRQPDALREERDATTAFRASLVALAGALVREYVPVILLGGALSVLLRAGTRRSPTKKEARRAVTERASRFCRQLHTPTAFKQHR